MTPLRSSFLEKTSDLRRSQTSNGVHPVSSSMSYVYVLRNAENGRLYTGFTFDLKNRLKRFMELMG